MTTSRIQRFRVPILIAGLAVVLVGARGLNIVASHHPVLALAMGFATAAGAVFGYRWLTRTVEGRTTVDELPSAGTWTGLRRGVLIGSAAFTTTMLLIGMFGGWDHVGGGSFGGMLISFGAMTSVAVNEELLFRGVIFRILEERVGSVVAIAASSLLFGLVHLVNPGATLWGTLAIGIEGGTMLAAAYVLTRSLWLGIGLHFAWNFVGGGLFGVTVSGAAEEDTSLLHTTLGGPEALTGGGFGPEASVFALVVGLAITVVMLRRAVRAGQLRPRAQVRESSRSLVGARSE
ncbi:CPBP family intramembrane glutamic endopeptidase [Cryptosporangium arvum]|uniref:CPBP family intramembrane glutamic endopeptidase n=1 Tax=Cryptosporangium arvum TaxID=80871 RepID=UPI0004B3224A|nr:CPBP family intramembrane glutamic endopeptidase [Cryptosporangium arvum]